MYLSSPLLVISISLFSYWVSFIVKSFYGNSMISINLGDNERGKKYTDSNNSDYNISHWKQVYVFAFPILSLSLVFLCWVVICDGQVSLIIH